MQTDEAAPPLSTWATDATALLVRLALPVLAFWVGTALLGLADYENGLERSVALVVLAGGCLLLPLTTWPSRRALVGGAAGLAVLTLLLAGVRVHQALTAVEEGRVPTVDIGTTTIAAVELTRDGVSPYTSRIDGFGDQVRPGGTGLDHFAGYKYGPVMTWAYTPGVRLAGPSGYFVTSLVALLLLAAAAAWWAWQAAGPAAGAGAGALVLAVAFTHEELFRGGVNDLVPMALVVGAFAARSRGGGVVAGLLLGLSFSAKLFPAALLALPLLLAVRTTRWRFVAAASVTSCAAYLPALLEAPREVVANLLLFNLARPGDRTGLLDGVPEALRLPVQLLLLGGVALVVVAVARTVTQEPDRRSAQARLAALTTLALALFFAQSPVLHRNYLFWIAPLFAVSVAVRVWGAPDAARPEAPRPARRRVPR